MSLQEPLQVNNIDEVLKGNMADDVEIITPKGIKITAGQLREETKNFDYKNSPFAKEMKSKRVEAIEFLTKKDKHRFDFKALLRDCLKGSPEANDIIRSIYNIKILNKSFKHLNVNSKRIALNSYLADKFMEHTAETEEPTVDLLSMLKNDNNIIDYAVLLKRVLISAVNQKVKLY